MSKIGIIVAMEEELEAVLNIMNNIEQKEIYEISVQIGKIEQKEVAVVKSGVGKVNAARVTQILIDKLNVKSIINLGSAGALSPLLNIGDIVIGEKLIQHDFDITAFDHDKGYITGVGDYIYSDIKLIEKFENAANNLKEKDYKIKKGIIATGDIFCTDIEMKNKIFSKFDADCVEMEGAAIAQVCYLDNIPFIVIRSISDSPNGNNEIDFDKFVELASKRCANILREFLK
mgnify:FL=1